jgi:hypothetical protein
MDPRHRFIRGDHDSPALAAAHPNFAGKFGFIPDSGGLFYLSGALTISAPVLQNSKYWYADEELSPREVNAAFDLYRESKPRILISHEGPSEIIAEMLAESFGNYAEAKRACVHSRTAAALQRMIEAHEPEQHFFGHYHRRWTAKRGTTTFPLPQRDGDLRGVKPINIIGSVLAVLVIGLCVRYVVAREGLHTPICGNGIREDNVREFGGLLPDARVQWSDFNGQEL